MGSGQGSSLVARFASFHERHLKRLLRVRRRKLFALGPEAGAGKTSRNTRVRTESQGFGSRGAREGLADALGALSASAVTQQWGHAQRPISFVRHWTRSVGMAISRSTAFRKSKV